MGWKEVAIIILAIIASILFFGQRLPPIQLPFIIKSELPLPPIDTMTQLIIITFTLIAAAILIKKTRPEARLPVILTMVYALLLFTFYLMYTLGELTTMDQLLFAVPSILYIGYMYMRINRGKLIERRREKEKRKARERLDEAIRIALKKRGTRA